MRNQPFYDDPWGTDPDKLAAADVNLRAPDLPEYAVDTIENIVPLDAQLGVTEKRNVPEALEDMVWGGGDITRHIYRA